MARLEGMLIALMVSLLALTLAAAQQCGRQAGGQNCQSQDDPCCSNFGFCGHTPPYCDRNNGCQSGCWSQEDLLDNTGKASHYSHLVPNACYGTDTSHLPRNRYVARVSDKLWNQPGKCGRHYNVRCQGKGCRNSHEIKVMVIDHCLKGCEGRVFDLSEEAFGAIADKNAGVINVEYAPIERANEISWDQEELITEVGRIRK